MVDLLLRGPIRPPVRGAACGVAVTLLLHVLVGPLMVPAVRTMDRPGARPGAKGGALQGAISRRLFHLRRPELRGMRGGGSDGSSSSAYASGDGECGVLSSPAEDGSTATARYSAGDASLEREHEDSGDIEVIESPPEFKAEHFEVEGADGERVFDFTKMHEQHPQARYPQPSTLDPTSQTLTPNPNTHRRVFTRLRAAQQSWSTMEGSASSRFARALARACRVRATIYTYTTVPS